MNLSVVLCRLSRMNNAAARSATTALPTTIPAISPFDKPPEGAGAGPDESVGLGDELELAGPDESVGLGDELELAVETTLPGGESPSDGNGSPGANMNYDCDASCFWVFNDTDEFGLMTPTI